MCGVASANMQRIGVVGCIDGDGGNAEELQCARDADGDFASVGDEHFVGGGGGQRLVEGRY